jgi:thiamine-phosphate pyrophosphorylase
MSRAQPETVLIAPGKIAGLYAITPEEPDTEVLARKVRAALAGGARLLQYRNKSADPRLRHEQATRLLALCRAACVPFIINDDLALALAIDAEGLHLGRDDGELATARAKLGPGKLLGASCYDRMDLAVSARAQGADYVAFGGAFASTTKPGAVRAPISLYGEAKARLGAPVVAIGGLTPENAGMIVNAGADAVAVISALFGAPDVEAAARRFCGLFHQKKP